MIDDRTLGRWMAWSRIAVGASMIIAPRLAGRPWHGRQDDPTVHTLTRSVGVRDVGIGVGLLSALRRDWEIAPWAGFSLAADAVDAFGMAAGYRRLQPGHRAVSLAAALAAVAAGLRIARIEGRTNPYAPSLAPTVGGTANAER